MLSIDRIEAKVYCTYSRINIIFLESNKQAITLFTQLIFYYNLCLHEYCYRRYNMKGESVLISGSS